MKNFLLVFLGGGFGSGLRYLITILTNQNSKFLPFGRCSVTIKYLYGFKYFDITIFFTFLCRKMFYDKKC